MIMVEHRHNCHVNDNVEFRGPDVNVGMKMCCRLILVLRKTTWVVWNREEKASERVSNYGLSQPSTVYTERLDMLCLKRYIGCISPQSL